MPVRKSTLLQALLSYAAAEHAVKRVHCSQESMYSFKQNQGVERRWVGFGGGVGQQQLEWAASELASAKAEGKRALVFSHCTFHPDAVNRPATLMWNYTDVLDVLWKAGNVAATFAGAPPLLLSSWVCKVAVCGPLRRCP